MQFSYWERESFIKGYDFVIIGAGIVGLSAALAIKEKEPSRKVLVIERGFLPTGASTKNAGFACFGSASELLDDVAVMGEAATFQLVEKRYRGLQVLRKRTGDAEIRFRRNGNYEVFTKNDQNLSNKCLEYLPELNLKIKEITGVSETYVHANEKIQTFGFRDVEHLILNTCEGQIDTGKMMKKLLDIARSKDVEFFFGAEVRKIEDQRNKVLLYLQSDFKLETQKVLVTTNGFARQLLPELEVNPARNQVMVTYPYKNMKFDSCFHYDRGYFYWREIDGRILIGGGRHLFPQEEMTDSMELNRDILNHLSGMLKDWITPHEFPGIDMQWSGILGLGSIKSPITKKISDNIAVSVRMGGMGVALGSLAGDEGAKLFIGN